MIFFYLEGIIPDSGLTGLNNTHTHTNIYIYIYIRIGTLNDLYFYELLISFLHMCMFLACYFRQRTFSNLLFFYTRPYEWDSQ